jgi:emfourin
MRIEFQMEGGIAHFPGLSRPVVIDSQALSPEDNNELSRLVEAARFFERPTVASAPRSGAADYRQYTIAVDDGERQHTIRLADPVDDPTLQPLLHFLQARARALRRGGGS